MAERAGADLLGLVGPMPSGPGVVSLDTARDIVAGYQGAARPVLLTAAHMAGDIMAEAARVGASAIQAVRHIAPQEARALGESGLHYLQVIHVEGPDSLDLIDIYGPHCDAFLLDSGKPAAGFLGGTGDVHDWGISAQFVQRTPRPVYLAGGLNPQNVGAALRRVRPYGVDICSGLRREGRLDPSLLAAYMSAIAGETP